MIEVKPLTYRELIGQEYYWRNWLLPFDIPLHPLVYDSEFAYTEEFLDEVCTSLPESMRRDISEIEQVLGKSLNIVVEDKELISEDKTLEVDLFMRRCISEGRIVSLTYSSTTIYIEPNEKRTLNKSQLKDHPMGLEKLEHYSSPSDEEDLYDEGHPLIVFWCDHNMDTAPEPARLYMRNFAIMFNNLGLERL